MQTIEIDNELLEGIARLGNHLGIDSEELVLQLVAISGDLMLDMSESVLEIEGERGAFSLTFEE